MYPEAGGSSSFARHAFNEFWSFFAAWAQMLNYTITIAISAFFVPHYLGGLFWPALQHGPGDVLFGIGVVALLSLVNVVGVKEAAGLNIVLAITDLATQLLLVVVGIALVLSPHVLIANVHLGVAPSWEKFLVAIPVGMIAYTGIETISNMAEEARDETKTIPKAIRAVVAAVFAIYAALPMVALSALRSTAWPTEATTRCSAPARPKAASPATPSWGSSSTCTSAPCSRPGRSTSGSSRRPFSSSPPTPASSAPRNSSTRWACTARSGPSEPPASALQHAVDRHPPVRRVACLTIIPGQAEFLGNMYAFGAMLSFTIAHLSVIRLRSRSPTARAPIAGPGTLRIAGRELPLFAVLGVMAPASRSSVTILHLDVAAAGVFWLTIGIRPIRRLPQAATASTCAPPPAPRATSVPPTSRSWTTRQALVPIFGDDVSATALQQRCQADRRRRRRYTPLYVLPVPSQLSLESGLEEEEAHGRSVLESARIQAAALGHQDPHRADSRPQPRRGARRGGRTRGL